MIDLTSHKKEITEENCMYLAAPTDLSGLSLAISHAIYSFAGKNSLLVFDSVSMFTIYNSKDITLRFLHFISNKLRANNVNVLFLFLKSEEDMAFAAKIMPFSDETKKL